MTLTYAPSDGASLYRELAQAEPDERIELLRRGLSPTLLTALAADTGVAVDALAVHLGIGRAALRRRLADGDRLTPAESEPVFDLALLMAAHARADAVAEGGTGDHPLAAWLRTPHPALGGRAPLQLMDVSEGRRLVARLAAARLPAGVAR